MTHLFKRGYMHGRAYSAIWTSSLLLKQRIDAELKFGRRFKGLFFPKHINMICTVTLNTAVDKVLYVNRFRPGQHVKARRGSVSAAGKGINVARGLAILGERVVCCGFTGEDQIDFFKAGLLKDNIDCKLTTCAGQTRTNVTITDPSEGESTHIREPGFEVSRDEMGRLKQDLVRIYENENISYVAFCGSLPGGVALPDLFELISAACEKKIKVILDIDGRNGRKLLSGEEVFAVKPNLEELRQYLNRSFSACKALSSAESLLESVEFVLLTMGKGGAFIIGREYKLKGSCMISDNEVKNTVGCGDAFLAGWLFGMEKKLPRDECFAYALACASAAACCSDAAGYSRQEVDRFLHGNGLLITEL